MLSFQLSDHWTCRKEGAEWRCTAKVDPDNAIMVIAAKEKGAADSIEEYLKTLSKPKKLQSKSSGEILSEPKSTALKSVGGNKWVESLHWQSEMPGTFTRYFAGGFKNVAVVATVTTPEMYLDEAGADLRNLVTRLKVKAKR